MGLILKEEGIVKMSSGDRYQLDDLSTIPRDDFSSIMDCLAQGIPFVGTYLAGKRRSKLKYCQIYKSAPRARYLEKGSRRKGHAVVLIGGGMEEGRKFFYGLSSWKTDFCPRRNTKGEIIKGGIGKLRASDLTKNVIKLSHPEKTDSCRRLEAQDVFDISKKNYILMMALKDQYTSMLRREKQVKSKKDDEKVQCDDEVFKKIREDHLVHGPFCDDEAQYSQNLEDPYNEYSSEEMEDSHMNNEKLHLNKVTTTSRTVAYYLGNQGSNQPNYLATIAPVIGSKSGTGITANSRTVATDGGLGSLNSADPGTMLGGSPDASRLAEELQVGSANSESGRGITANSRTGATGGLGGLNSADSWTTLGASPVASRSAEELQVGSANSESGIGITANSRTGTTGGLGGLNSADSGITLGGSPDASRSETEQLQAGSVNSKLGIGMTANSRTVATDGGLGGLSSADTGTTLEDSPNASRLGTGGHTDLGTQMSMLTVAGGGENLHRRGAPGRQEAGSATPLSSQK